MIKRRSFFGMLLGALCAPFVPKPKLPRLMFHKDAFAMTMAPLELVRVPQRMTVASGAVFYAWSSDDVAIHPEDYADMAQPHIDNALKALAEAIDRG